MHGSENPAPVGSIPATDSRIAWMARARKTTARKRVPLIERALRALPKMPTASTVFFRKQLLRLLDKGRLEAGMVSAAELHKENSPFAEMDFSSAKIIFRPRLPSPARKTREP